MLVTTGQLAANLENPLWVVCDCRHDLAIVEAGRRAYLQSHIPGARFLHLDEDLSGPRTGKNGRHPLPDPNTLAARLGATGIGPGKRVVAYDDAGGMFAVRLWWLLRWLGHGEAALLDGGWQKWLAEGRPVTDAIPRPVSAVFASNPDPGAWVDAGYVLEHLGHSDLHLIDARSPERFLGEVEPMDPVAGHIPGAMNRFFKHNLDSEGRFRPAGELRREFEALLGEARPEQVVHQCGSGVTACHNLFAMELAGLAGSKLYPGSWSEWCADPARPVAKGSS